LRDDFVDKRDKPTDHDVAVRVKQETPDSAALPEGVAPVAGHHEDKE
jgi:hypothetical protein